jgi:hypothetical protein
MFSTPLRAPDDIYALDALSSQIDYYFIPQERRRKANNDALPQKLQKDKNLRLR